jgi:hypothetical protein
VWTSHSATGAIKSALKYVSPDAHWIARHLVTAGGKTYKNAALQRNRHRPHRPFGPVLNQLPVTTTTARQQHSYVPSDRRPARGSTPRRTCTSLAGRWKSPRSTRPYPLVFYTLRWATLFSTLPLLHLPSLCMLLLLVHLSTHLYLCPLGASELLLLGFTNFWLVR